MQPSTLVLAIAATALLLAAPARAESLDGAYRGSYVCEKTQATQNILRVPIDVLVTQGRPLRAAAVQPARHACHRTELASGTVDDAGKLHMASDYVVLGFAVHGDYEGTIGPHDGTFTGTQSWQWPDGRRGSRTCVAAFVPSPRATHPAAPQQQWKNLRAICFFAWPK